MSENVRKEDFSMEKTAMCEAYFISPAPRAKATILPSAKNTPLTTRTGC